MGSLEATKRRHRWQIPRRLLLYGLVAAITYKELLSCLSLSARGSAISAAGYPSLFQGEICRLFVSITKLTLKSGHPESSSTSAPISARTTRVQPEKVIHTDVTAVISGLLVRPRIYLGIFHASFLQ
jgi:hypothetical protein